MDQQSRIIQCPACGTKNRVPGQKPGLKAKCGKCGEPLDTEQEFKNGKSQFPGDFILVRCLSCGTKNRVPENKMDDTVKCGKCHKPLETAGLLSQRSIMTSDRDFDVKVMKSPVPVLFFAFADWCPSCRVVMPAVEELAREWKGKVRVAKLNVDHNPSTANRFNIMSVPTIIVLDYGRVKERLTGAVPKLQIVEKVAPFLYG